MLKVTIEYTDKDHPYSFNDRYVLFVNTLEDAENLCKQKSSRRQYWSIVDSEDLEN